MPNHPRGRGYARPNSLQYVDAILDALRIGCAKGYTGSSVADTVAKAGVTAHVVSGKPGRGFVVQPRRWVVERTSGRFNH